MKEVIRVQMILMDASRAGLLSFNIVCHPGELSYFSVTLDQVLSENLIFFFQHISFLVVTFEVDLARC